MFPFTCLLGYIFLTHSHLSDSLTIRLMGKIEMDETLYSLPKFLNFNKLFGKHILLLNNKCCLFGPSTQEVRLDTGMSHLPTGEFSGFCASAA